MTLRAAIEALRHDAGMWQEVATATGAARTAADGLALGESALSWASRPTGLLDTYEEIRAKAAGLLGEATSGYAALGAALTEVAAAYEAGDEAASARLHGVWDPRR
jgi:hypothetical protein